MTCGFVRLDGLRGLSGFIQHRYSARYAAGTHRDCGASMKPKRYYTSSCLLPYRNGGWRGRLKFKKQDGTYGQVSKVMASKSKRAAQAELREWREEMEDLTQKKLKLGSMAHKTVKDLLDGYIDMLSASGSIESSTVYDYRGAARLVERRIGGIEFDSLDVTAAQNWINWAVAEGYKPSTIRKSVTLLKAAYRDAVGRLRIIDYSPVDCVRVPKARHREPNALGEQERGRLLTFLSIARDCPENVGIYLALLTGMRRGELLALRWRNVDFDQKMLHVKASIGFGEDGHYEKEPKNGGSRRSIPMPDEVAGILTRRLTAARAECFKAGVPFERSMFVLGGPDGEFMAPERLSRHWAVTVRQLGLVGSEGEPPKFHDLRHTFATAAILAGTDIKSVSSLLGHANAAMTLNIYTGVNAQAKRTAMEAVAATMTSTPPTAEILELRAVGE